MTGTAGQAAPAGSRIVHGSPSTGDLLSLLRPTLGERRVSSLVRRPSGYRTSFPLEEVDVWLDDGSPLRLLFKDVSPAALGSARKARPRFLQDAGRELLVYRDILDPDRWGTAACHGVSLNPGRGRYWLLIERVSGVELYQCGNLETWKHVARWLASFHRGMSQELDVQRARAAHLLVHDEAYYTRWRRRAQQLLPRRTPTRVSVRNPVVGWLLERYDLAAERLLVLPRTMVHGEPYASNVLVNEATGRVCPVDWEMAALAPDVMDLAAFIAGGWSPAEKTALSAAYFGPDPTPSRAEDLRCAQLHVAIQWLARSAEWQPPAEHRQDWLAEALRLAEEIQP